MFFLTVVTAYQVVAYLVGKKLTSLQFTIVNTCFLISASILGYLIFGNFRVFYIYASSGQEGLVSNSDIAPTLVDFTWPIIIFLAVLVLGSLTFMYSVRKSESGESDA